MADSFHFVVPAIAILVPSAALAHTGRADASGFAYGFWHPVSGVDHVLTMVMVGVLAWQVGRQALWLVPGAFVLMMVLGGAAGAAGTSLPFVEVGVALSVVVLGTFICVGAKLPIVLGIGMAGFFAIFHGYAHGAEMPEYAGGLGYVAGFTAATVLLHVAGITGGFVAAGTLGDRLGTAVARSIGGGAALLGSALVLAGL